MITASQQIDRVSDSLTRLAQSRVIPAREVKPLLVRLDRVANTLDQGVHARQTGKKKVQAALQDFESELERLGYKYTAKPGVGIAGSVYFVPKNQKDHREEEQELRNLAEKHGGNLESPPKSRSYVIHIVSLEHNK